MGGGGNGARRAGGAGTGSWNATSSSLAAALMHTVADSWHTAEQRVSRASQAQAAAVDQRRRQAALTVLALLAAFSSAAVVLLERFSGQDYPGLAAAALLGACALFLFFLQELPSLAKSQSGDGGDDIPQTEQSREELLAWMARQSAEVEAQAMASQRLLSDSAVTAREPVDWLNKLVLRLWPNAIAPGAASHLEAALLGVEVQQLSLGEAAPQVSSTTGVCWTSLDSSPSTGGAGERQEGLCAGVEWTSTTLAIQVRLTFAEGKAVTLLVSGIQLSGMIRVVPVLHSCGLLWAFTHAPAIRLAVAVAPGETNPSSDALSGVPFWLESCIQSALASHFVEPRRQFLPLTPHPTSALHLAPSRPLPPGPLSLRLTLIRATGLRHLSSSTAPASSPRGPQSDAPQGIEPRPLAAKELGFGPVVVEISSAQGSTGAQDGNGNGSERVVVSSPGVSGPGSSVDFVDGPALLASHVCASGETRVHLRAYALQPKGAAPLLLGSATIDVRVFEGGAHRRYAVAWGLGSQEESGETSHPDHPHHRHRKRRKHRKHHGQHQQREQQQSGTQPQHPTQQQQQQQQGQGRDQENHSGGGVPTVGQQDDQGLHGSADVGAVACLEAVGEEQHIAVALEHLEGPDWHLGGEIEVALSLTPTVLPQPTEQQGSAPKALGAPGAGHVLKVGVLEAKGLGTGGAVAGGGEKGLSAPAAAPAAGVCVRVSYGGDSKCTRGVPDANPVWRETLDFEREQDPAPSQPFSVTPFFPLSSPHCNGDTPNGTTHGPHGSSTAPGAPSSGGAGPRFLHLACLPAKGRWGSGGKSLGSAVVDLWALPSLEGPSPLSLWVPLAHPSGTGGEIRVSLHRVASAMARAEQQAALSSRTARQGPASEGAEGAVLGVLVERAVGLPPKEGGTGRGLWGDVYAAVSLSAVTRKTKVVHSSVNPEWDEKMWFKWPAPGAHSSLPSPPDPSASLDASLDASLEVVVKESLGLSGRAVAAATAAFGGRSTTGTPSAQGAGVIGTGSIALSELEGIKEWPHQISIPLSVPMKRTPSLVPMGRRNSDPGLNAANPPRVVLTLARAPSAAEALDRLYGHVPPLDTFSSNESQPTEPSQALQHSQPLQSSQPSQQQSQPQSQSLSQPLPRGPPPPQQPLALKPETLQQLQQLQLQRQQHKDKAPSSAASSVGPATRGAAPGAPGAGAANPRQLQIQRTTAELAACVKTLQDSLVGTSTGSQLAPHLDRLASAAQEQGRLMQALLADRDLVLRKVAELKSVLGLQAQVNAAAQAQAQAAAAGTSVATSAAGVAAAVPS